MINSLTIFTIYPIKTANYNEKDHTYLYTIYPIKMANCNAIATKKIILTYTPYILLKLLTVML